SLPQNRRICQPCFFNSLFTILSRLILLSILFHQNFRFVLILNFSLAQFFPCQYSLSTNTATLYFLNVRSGVPKTVLSFFLYLCPFFHSALASFISILVSLPFMACMFLRLCSFVKTSML